jgi:hypothetical protein
MSTTTRYGWRGILVLFLLAMTACARPTFAANCEQPQVVFRDGQLSISSAGCSLQKVLTAMARQTGIETEAPASASAIAVYADLGPGNPRQVLRALLEGIPFNWSFAIKEDGSPNVERVMLTEQIAPLEVAKPVAAAALTRPILATGSRELLAGQGAPKTRGEGTRDATTSDASLGSPQSDQPQRRADIDDSTLSKLPALPPGVPSGMWGLYPGIVDNGGAVQSGPPLLPNGQLASATTVASAPSTAVASAPSTAPRGCTSCPVPPGVNPLIVTIYPPNLMQLIQMPITLPNIQIPPMASPIPSNH